MQTEVTITPIENTKRASVTGEAAVGETVQFRLKGCGSEFAHLRLRIRVGRIDAAVFPRPDATPADIWRIDGNDAVCGLSLATRELRLASVSRRSVRCEAIVDDGGEDTMLCSVPLVLKVWRRGLAPLPEPSGPANDWKARCDAIDEALRNESSHRVAGDDDLSERIDAIVVPEQTVKSVNGKTGDVVLGSGDINGASGRTVAEEIAGVAETAAGKYSKPSSGIPSGDLAPAVQAALSDARTPLQHAASHKTGGSDALAPSDIGAASVAYATLNQAWTVAFALTDAQKESFSLTPGASDNDYALTVGKNDGGTWTLYVGSYNAASLTTDTSGNLVLSRGDARLDLQAGDLVATPAGYRLGPDTAANPNRDKALAPADAIPAVVAPSTAAADAGKAADAKATGDALAGKAGSARPDILGHIRIEGDANQEDPSINFDNTANSGGVVRITFSGGGPNDDFDLYLPRASGTLALVSQIPAVSAETWTFEIDDGQGGTETVTKSVAVFAQAAQGGTP